MNYSYDLQYIKENLTIEQIEEVLIEFGGEPTRKGDVLISRTICHNHSGEGTFKLYYYDNSHLFHCFTDCGESFDVFELIRKFMSREHPKTREDGNWNLPEAVDYIARKFGYSPNVIEEENELTIQRDLTILQNYDRIKEIDINTQKITLKEYDGYFLKNLPSVCIEPWLKEGITKEVMNHAEIKFDPLNQGIVIPHRDINNRLIGISERTLIQEQAEMYGKYMPARISGKMYTHPLSYNLYNLNHSKDNISRMKKAIVFESEKSCLKYRSYFGEENDLSVATCGSSFLNYHCWLLMQLGVDEIIIGFDHDFTDVASDEAKRIIKNLKNIHKKYGAYVKISFLWDSNNLLGYKDSPIDKDKETFIYLFNNRINIY
jgi:hypothetical protein